MKKPVVKIIACKDIPNSMVVAEDKQLIFETDTSTNDQTECFILNERLDFSVGTLNKLERIGPTYDGVISIAFKNTKEIDSLIDYVFNAYVGGRYNDFVIYSIGEYEYSERLFNRITYLEEYKEILLEDRTVEREVYGNVC